MPGIWNQIVVWVQLLALSFLSWVTLGKGPRLSERQGPLDLMELIMLTFQGTGRTLSTQQGSCSVQYMLVLS